MLSMNSGNCARYGDKMRPLERDANDKLEQAMITHYKSIWRKMLDEEVSGNEMCDYLDWAYYARVALDGDMETYKKIHQTVC